MKKEILDLQAVRYLPFPHIIELARITQPVTAMRRFACYFFHISPTISYNKHNNFKSIKMYLKFFFSLLPSLLTRPEIGYMFWTHLPTTTCQLEPRGSRRMPDDPNTPRIPDVSHSRRTYATRPARGTPAIRPTNHPLTQFFPETRAKWPTLPCHLPAQILQNSDLRTPIQPDGNRFWCGYGVKVRKRFALDTKSYFCSAATLGRRTISDGPPSERKMAFFSLGLRYLRGLSYHLLFSDANRACMPHETPNGNKILSQRQAYLKIHKILCQNLNHGWSLQWKFNFEVIVMKLLFSTFLFISKILYSTFILFKIYLHY